MTAPSTTAIPPPPTSTPAPAAQLPPEILALLARLSITTTPAAPTQDATAQPPALDAAAPPPALDAEAVANLHSQAVAVLNVKALVPVTLDLDANNYSRWQGLFLVALGKYALTDHVFSDVPRPDHADWTQMDCVVLSWLYGSISSTLMQEVLSPTATACSVWHRLHHGSTRPGPRPTTRGQGASTCGRSRPPWRAA
ncbi:hypothetical protein OsJ_14112 [Oryza sativa Japonica Group]|uniref:Retrotransposon Copia-like N-terminal domain-containing protein n=1 Tax=Oryza sativa subsp. japonica TaxID=39947 RepID=B9FE77_ORYSJ|nr:hypothetical protein OsJ_14112 [Oryza sativa Japonica Group]